MKMTEFLHNCRFLLIIPVIGCVLLTIGAVFMGIARIINTTATFMLAPDFSVKMSKILALSIIEIIDLFLIGTVSYIVAVGVYKLFISSETITFPSQLKINNLKDLEDKIIGVIIAALAVTFLGMAAGTDNPASLLNFGGGIALVIAALTYFMRNNDK